MYVYPLIVVGRAFVCAFPQEIGALIFDLAIDSGYLIVLFPGVSSLLRAHLREVRM